MLINSPKSNISSLECISSTEKPFTSHRNAKNRWNKKYSIYLHISWWRHQMEIFAALVALFVGNSPVTIEFPTQRPVTRSFGVFFDLRLNKCLCRHSWGWWFETPLRSLWRHCNVCPILSSRCFSSCTLWPSWGCWRSSSLTGWAGSLSTSWRRAIRSRASVEGASMVR